MTSQSQTFDNWGTWSKWMYVGRKFKLQRDMVCWSVGCIFAAWSPPTIVWLLWWAGRRGRAVTHLMQSTEHDNSVTEPLTTFWKYLALICLLPSQCVKGWLAAARWRNPATVSIRPHPSSSAPRRRGSHKQPTLLLGKFRKLAVRCEAAAHLLQNADILYCLVSSVHNITILQL